MNPLTRFRDWIERVNLVVPREHDFELHEVLIEPGISDLEGGRWARRRALCERCGEERKVWRSVNLSDLNRVTDCVPT